MTRCCVLEEGLFSCERIVYFPWLDRILEQKCVSMIDEHFCDQTLFSESLEFDGVQYSGWPELAQQPINNYKSFTNNTQIGMKLIEDQLNCGAIEEVDFHDESITLNPIGIANISTKPRLTMSLKFNKVSRHLPAKLDNIQKVVGLLHDFEFAYKTDGKSMFFQYPV